MRRWWMALVLLSCQRTTPEDFPPAREASAVGTVRAGESVQTVATGLPPGRCVHPTPAEPPGPVPLPAASCPVDPEGGPPQVPVVHVGFADAGGVGVEAELVRSSHDSARGLMYRRSMPVDHGMLFDLRVRDDHNFWMHNTCIPLDLLYVDEDGLIVGIAENAPTLSDATISVGCPSRWVLEVNAGWSRKHGVKAGQRIVLPG